MKLNFEIEYRTVWGESVGVGLGSFEAPIMLSTSDGITWHGTAEVKLPTGGLALLYRYGIYRDGECIRREQGSMPHIINAEMAKGKRSLNLYDRWQDPKRVAGVAIPVFSLRSEGSFGVGDFGDLKLLIDWAQKVGMSAVQILPIYDTTINHTWTDSYPYNSTSIYALHPQYIDLRQLPALKDAKKAAYYEQQRLELNALPQLDYVRVNNQKRAYLHDLFEQEGKKTFSSFAFRAFLENNNEWMRPYATYSVLRDQYQTADFRRWPKYQKYDESAADMIFAEGSETLHQARFYIFCQYLLHVQLLSASNYAREKGVILKGDIPIGISQSSVEAWVEPFYFNMKGSAGAPPDPFSANGQNWGFPTYNWDAMQKDGLKWWMKRFGKMAEYFTAYRIDHLLGFFRIWEIPTHSVHGLLGQFSPALPMSPDEISAYGITFQKEFMTEPFINDELLQLRFGHIGKPETLQWVKDTFLMHLHDDIWAMKPEFSTQRQVEGFFSGKTKDDEIAIREALYTLISNVLFLEDHKQPGLYHPRISAQTDYLFTRLQNWEKDAFNTLYYDYFYRRHNQFWYEQAMQKLPRLIDATQMIVCGEDLGMVPECVPWVMNQLQILSLEIQRMPKSPEDEFGHVNKYPVNSVCTTGTHDTETLREWWELDPELTQNYWEHELHETGEAPKEATPEICQRIVKEHLECPSLLCILPLQDWLACNANLRFADANAERINIPANPRHYWRWRMHLTLEQLMQANAFNEQVRNLILASKR